MAAVNAPRMDYGRTGARTTGVIETDTVVVSRRDLSWGAVIAGVIVVLVTMVALNMLGLAIGATTVNPLTEANPVDPALGTAAVFWFVGTGLLALFAGGWVASHLAVTYDQGTGFLHGLVTWGVSTLIAFVLVTTSVGNLVTGLTGVVGQGLSILTQGALNNAPEVADALNLQGATRDAIMQESNQLLRNQNTPGTTGTDTTGDTTGTTGTTAQNAPGSTFDTLDTLDFNNRVLAFLNGNQEDTAARQELVTYISERTGLTADQANTQLDRWTQSFNSVRDNAETAARQVGEQLANTLTTIGGALFLAMLLGAVAGSVGGVVGTRDLDREVSTVRTTTGD
ncbi:MAG: hypothetical protein U0670_24215 [Anaerolineae bacterium]